MELKSDLELGILSLTPTIKQSLELHGPRMLNIRWMMVDEQSRRVTLHDVTRGLLANGYRRNRMIMR